jgi:uncharacterized protein (DUF433 family)
MVVTKNWLKSLKTKRPRCHALKDSIKTENPRCHVNEAFAQSLKEYDSFYELAKRDQAMNYQQFITIEPGKRGGKPCVRGLRITAYDVLEQLASGLTPAEIAEDLPELTEADIYACLSLAADKERNLERLQAPVFHGFMVGKEDI